jgi:N-acetylglucosaminyldiphosphoundecaprenol N-acetyl-beta-D-mannosaminyltransferase
MAIETLELIHPTDAAQESRPPEPPEPDRFQRVRVLGLELARLSGREALDQVERLIQDGEPSFFITANLHYAMLTARDPRLAVVNRRAAFLLADGMPLVWYSRLRGRPLPERVAGSDLIYLLCERAAQRGHRLFLLGGIPGVAQAAADELCRLYPGLQIAGIAAPEIGRLSAQEHADLIGRVRRARPDLLFAALGQPKGEIWLAENCLALGVPACVQLGASFDFVAGRVRRAPRWTHGLGLEWLWRITREPRRMVPRYAADAWFLARTAIRDAVSR